MTVRATRRIIAYVESKQYKFCSKRNARCHEGTRNHSKICSNTFRTINFRRARERKEEKKSETFAYVSEGTLSIDVISSSIFYLYLTRGEKKTVKSSISNARRLRSLSTVKNLFLAIIGREEEWAGVEESKSS